MYLGCLDMYFRCLDLYFGCLDLYFRCLYACRMWLWRARSPSLIDADDADDDANADDGEPTTATPHSHQQANTHRDQISRSGDTPSLLSAEAAAKHKTLPVECGGAIREGERARHSHILQVYRHPKHKSRHKNTSPDTQNTSPDTQNTSPDTQIQVQTPKIQIQTPKYKSRHPKYKF